ncbi:MAG: tetratricopeptide repeat protein [candidate division KSB1 bacterium]|nr:tetratricopeptide repeat protein [candidate division KSB1 bacterium]MDZ7301095.1 tetratricopeptide repeat protein [candidate division KSB1 bacterium]MDZ7312020.1 tetratricopeptide repeat protein [candidate division KSB1 bacterium]
MLGIIDKILNKLTGFDFWFVMMLLIIGLAGVYYLGQTIKESEKKAKSQLLFIGTLILIGMSEIAIHQLFFSPIYIFPQDTAGILILRIEGDDQKNSLQRDLVRTLNTALSEEASSFKIEVRPSNKTVAEDLGLAQAHKQARSLGKISNAKLVIWGTEVGEKKFHPRLTIVDEEPRAVLLGDRALAAQNLSEVNLTAELVNSPIYVTHFVVGYTLFDRKNFAAALAHFKAVLSRPVVNAIELNEIRYYAGKCHYYLAKSQKDAAGHLQQAIAYYDTVLSLYSEQTAPKKWAIVQHNLANAYAQLPTGNRSENLQRAIAAYEAALRVFTEEDSPKNWAILQNNLGSAYADLPTGNQNANLQKAIAAYHAALRVYSEKDFPVDWATIQNNLGVAYLKLPAGNRADNLQKALAAIEAALRVYTEKDFPVDWAMAQNNLGTIYSELPTGDRDENIQKAIAAYQASLRVRTEKDFPLDWAATQNNLGNAYWSLTTGDQNENLQKAIAAYESALRVRTEKDFPLKWAMTQNNLGIAYASLTAGDRQQNLQKTVEAFEAALRVFTKENFPAEWASTQNNLGNAYVELTTGDHRANLQKAIGYFKNALQIWTADAFPEEHKMATESLQDAQRQLQKLAKK